VRIFGNKALFSNICNGCSIIAKTGSIMREGEPINSNAEPIITEGEPINSNAEPIIPQAGTLTPKIDLIEP
jgi:hypothetical protein